MRSPFLLSSSINGTVRLGVIVWLLAAIGSVKNYETIGLEIGNVPYPFSYVFTHRSLSLRDLVSFSALVRNYQLGYLKATTSRCRFVLCNRFHCCISMSVRFKSCRDQVLRTRAHPNDFTATLFWRSSLSKADGAFIRRAKVLNYRWKCWEWVHCANKYGILGKIIWELYVYDRWLINTMYCARTHRESV